eukprot:TRINITY_DN7633_c0_g2_i1.p1 TRINITY_DN7633_c0_g2~~TRINITY_DN7633_c0_g2_i1.p1  ORF type:complete len:629 (+),score=33.10 TRINITY_DN7633_c0_g2_i1:238-1887(+)
MEVSGSCYKPPAETVAAIKMGGISIDELGLWGERVVLNSSSWTRSYSNPWGDLYVQLTQPRTSDTICGITVRGIFLTNPPITATGPFTMSVTPEDSVVYTPSVPNAVPKFALLTEGFLQVGSARCEAKGCSIPVSHPVPQLAVSGDGLISCAESISEGEAFTASRILTYPPFDTVNQLGIVASEDATFVSMWVPGDQVGTRWYLTIENQGPFPTVAAVYHDIQNFTNHDIPASSVVRVTVDYPPQGWNTVSLVATPQDGTPLTNITIRMDDVTPDRCPEDCRGRGRCATVSGPGNVFVSTCDCNRPYKGWGCEEFIDGSRYPPRFWFLVLSNAAFMPSIFTGLRLAAFTESLVYASNMLASILYHMCDENVADLCLWTYDNMQFLDFFSSFMSLWVTIMYLARVSDPLKGPVNALGALSLASAATINRENVGSVAVPFVVIGVVAFGHWVWHCVKANDGRFERGMALKHIWVTPWFHWRYFIPGVVCAVAAFITNTALQTDANYATTHSIWHLLIGFCPTLFLLAPLKPTYTVFAEETEYTSLLNDDVE